MTHTFLHRHPELEKYLPDTATESTEWHVVVDGNDWEKTQGILSEEDFRTWVHSLLPDNIIIEDIRYQIQVGKIVGGYYRIGYDEFEDDRFNYDNEYSQLIDVMDKSPNKCLERVLQCLKICIESNSKNWLYNQALEKLSNDEYEILKERFSTPESNESQLKEVHDKISNIKKESRIKLV